jgi:hypothetical protein
VFFLTFFYFFFKKSCFLDNFAIQLYIAIFNKKRSCPIGRLLYRVSSKEGALEAVVILTDATAARAASYAR